MTESRQIGSLEFDEMEDSELSLCCICGKTFTDRLSLHNHVDIIHKDSDAPPVAHSSTFPTTDISENLKTGWSPDPSITALTSALLAAAAAAAVAATSTIHSGECGGESSDDSCHPQDLRIRRSPVDTLSSGSVSTAPIPSQAPIRSMHLLPQNFLSHQPSPSGSLTNQASFLYQRHHDISREAYDAQSDAVHSAHSSINDYPSTERLPSHTSSPAGKSYHCDLCNKNFTKSCNLNSHVKAVHKGVRAFQCNECQKSFSRNSDLQKHIDAVHKGLRPYECATCLKRFSQKSSLKRHREAVHEGIKAFQCNHCSARFSYDVHLKRHTRAKHKNIHSSNSNANGGGGGVGNSNAATMASHSSNSMPSSPVFQQTSLRQASI